MSWHFPYCGVQQFYLLQGAYNSGKPGKHGNLREFVNSGKLREFKIYSGNLSDAIDCYQIVSLGHRVVCIIVSNSSVNWLGDTQTKPGQVELA